MAERVWPKIDTSGGLFACWPWTGHRKPAGYGVVTIGRQFLAAHRMAFELANGPIPTGLWVLHHCDNPPCCNPAHLFLGDRAANMQDAAAKGRLSLQRNPERAQRLQAFRATQAGEANPHARLTAAGVREIRASDRSEQVLAEAYGVARSTVRDIRRRKRWAHV